MSAGGEEDVDYYAVLDVKEDADAQEIKTAYRKRSLKVHPDRNPDNPAAASLFHALKQAYEVLCDPGKKATFDALLVARNARKLRFQGLDNKRKALAEDLDRREKEFKRAKGDELRERGELERLKDEGRRMRESRDAGALEELARVDGARRDEQERVKRAEDAARRTGAVDLGPLDTTLRVKWAPARYPDVLDSASLESALRTRVAPQPLDFDSIVLSAKFRANPAKGKHASAVVAFKSIRAAVRVLDARAAAPAAWDGIEVSWAAGEPPAVLGGSRDAEMPQLAKPKPPSFPAAMMVDSSEDRILAQLRAKERQKLMDEMRRQEEQVE